MMKLTHFSALLLIATSSLGVANAADEAFNAIIESLYKSDNIEGIQGVIEMNAANCTVTCKNYKGFPASAQDKPTRIEKCIEKCYKMYTILTNTYFAGCILQNKPIQKTPTVSTVNVCYRIGYKASFENYKNDEISGDFTEIAASSKCANCNYNSTADETADPYIPRPASWAQKSDGVYICEDMPDQDTGYDSVDSMNGDYGKSIAVQMCHKGCQAMKRLCKPDEGTGKCTTV